jgi:hypothetical protein
VDFRVKEWVLEPLWRESLVHAGIARNTLFGSTPSTALTALYADDILNHETNRFFPRCPEEYG